MQTKISDQKRAEMQYASEILKFFDLFLVVSGEGQECSLVDDNGNGEMYGAFVEEEENKHDGWIACKQKASFVQIFP